MVKGKLEVVGTASVTYNVSDTGKMRKRARLAKVFITLQLKASVIGFYVMDLHIYTIYKIHLFRTLLFQSP